jgi:phosphoglycerate dehydrogenase-like enzyme
MLGPRQIDLLRPGAIVINTSRGGVIDQAALKEALKQGRISAGLDVFAEEPARDLELLALPNLVGTPHVGGNAAEAVQAMGLSALRHLTMHFGRPFNY